MGNAALTDSQIIAIRKAKRNGQENSQTPVEAPTVNKNTYTDSQIIAMRRAARAAKAEQYKYIAKLNANSESTPATAGVVSKTDYIKSLGLVDQDFQYQTVEEYDAEIAKLNEQIRASVQKNNPQKYWWNYLGLAAVGGDVGGAMLQDQQRDYTSGETSAYTKRRDALVNQRNLLERQQQVDAYGTVAGNADFAQRSAVDATINDDTYRWINDIDGYRSKARNTYNREVTRAAATGNSDFPQGSAFTMMQMQPDYEKYHYDLLNDGEIQKYNYLVATDAKRARQYLEDLHTTLQHRYSVQEQMNTTEAYEKASGFGKGVMNAASVGMKVVGDAVGAVNDIVETVTGNYSPYGTAHSLTNMATAIRGATSQDIVDAIDKAGGSEAAGQIASNVYQALMSGADSVVGGLTLGKGYLYLAGAGAASQKAKELYEKGASGAHILTGSLASGAIEVLLEKLPLDELLNAKATTRTIRGVITSTLKQSGIEATGEALTELTNIVADCLIQGANSDMAQLQQQYISKGNSETDAYRLALRDKATEVAWSGFGGAISGGASGFTFSSVGLTQYNAEVQRIGRDYINGADGHTIDEALAIGLNNAHTTEAYKIADAINKKVQSGQSVSAADVGRMLVESSTPEAAKARALDHAVRESAQRYGVAEDIAEDMANIAAATGRTIEFATDDELGATIDGDNTVAGSYDPATGIVKINAAATAEDARNYIIKHELVHSVEGTRQWEQLADIVQAQMGDEGYSAAVAQMMEKRAAIGQVLDMSAAEQEVIAEWIGDNLYKGNFAQAIVNGDATIGNAFVRTIDKLRLALGNKKSRANTQLGVVERLFMRALEQDVELREGDVEFFASTSDKSTSIKEQLREHLGEINEMEPVANISYHHVDRLTARQAVSREFKRLGNKIDRQGFGIIEIGEDEIDVSANYIHTPAECAAWFAVPKVLKRGKLIFAKDNHKERGHDTITIAAPVVINETPGLMAVVVKQTGKNRYKSHRILMPDGSVFVYQDAKNAEPTSASMTTQTSGEGPAISSASNTRLSQNDPRVNTQSMQNAGENTPKPQNAVVNRAWMMGDTTVDRHGNPVENPVSRQTPVRSQVQNAVATIDSSSVKEQLRANSSMLDEMSTVADIRVSDDFFGMNKTEKQNWVIDRLEASGYQVDRTGFGIISFAKKRLKSAFNYFKKGSAEEVVFEALPSVLENGVEISSRAEHKGRGYGTVTIAAPITINGRRGNMAVVVKRTDGNHYKVHRVLTPDGAEFALADITNEAESTPAGESPINGSLATPINSASINSIPKTPPIVKQNSVNYEALSNAGSVEDVIEAVGDEEAYRRLHFASQINRPTGTVDVDGRTMTADEYMAEQYHSLPDDEDTIRAAIKQTEAAIADELKRTVIEGGNDAATLDLSDHPNILKLNIQLFAEKAKLDYVLDKGEEGNKSRRFYEQRLKGKDANHNQELVDMLKGQNETYNPIGNEALLRDANKLLRDSSLKDELTRKTLRYRTKEMLTPVEVAAVQLMINDHINNGDLSMARKLVLGGARKGTELGRAVQAFSMMARLTPEGLLRAATRATRRAADKSLFEGADGQLDIAAQKVMDALEQLQERGNVSAEDVLRLFKNLDKFGAPEQISRVIKNVIEQAEKKGAKANKSSTTDMNDPWTLADEIAESAANDGLSDVGIRDYLTNLLGLPKLTDAEAGILIDSAMRMQNADKDSPEWQQAMDEACTVLASKIPNTTWEVLTEWRKFAMLFNLKTHARNYFSNVAYRGVRSVDSFNESMLQALLIKLGKMNPEDRSAYFGWSFTEQGRNLMKDGKLQKAAEAALSERKKTALKYGPDQAALQEYRQYFKQKWLNKIKDKNYQWMEMEDAPFFKSAYVNALGQYLVSKGETEISQEADNYAYQRALEAIFSADNAISNTLSSLKQQGAFGKAVDVAVPFHRTPSNVLVQGFYHSPLGLIKGSYDLVRVLRGAKTAKTAADAINEIAKGMTGTMLFGIGILLGSLGMFNTGYGKTEKERAADELAGVQENAIVIGDFSMSLDWLQPAAAPLIMGASIAQRLNEDGQSIGAVFGAVMDGTDSLFELTMLQSLYDALGGYDAGVTSTAGSLLENVVSQSVPTVVGQAARTIDPTRRKTNGSITGLDFFDTIINQIVAKIPGLTYLLDPELDVWGNEVYRTGRSSTGSSVINAIQQFALPINIKIGTGNGDAISEEIERLYSEHGSSAIPTAVSRDEAMDGGLDYVESNRLLGAVNRQAVEDFINNKWPYTVQSTLENGKRRNVTKFYEDMTDEERVRVLKRIYKKSKEQVSEPNEADDTYFADIMRRLE